MSEPRHEVVTDLEVIGEPVRRFAEHKRDDIAEGTWKKYRQTFRWLDQFMVAEDIGGLDELREDDQCSHLSRWDSFMAEGRGDYGDTLNRNTRAKLFDHLKIAIDFWAFKGLCRDELNDGLEFASPDLDAFEDVRDDVANHERVFAIFKYFEKNDPEDDRYVLLRVLWDCGRRLGATLGLDEEDIRYDDAGDMFLRFDDPDALKQDRDACGDVVVSHETQQTIERWLESSERTRHLTDEGRRPIFTTNHGRMAESTAREKIYGITRPCEIKGECPFDREIASCDAARLQKKAATCPGSLRPHALRGGRATWGYFQNGEPKSAISERQKMSLQTLNRHYLHGTSEQGRQKQKSQLGMEPDDADEPAEIIQQLLDRLDDEPRTSGESSASRDPIKEIERMADLRDRGLISEHEFEEKKQDLLARI